MKTTMIIILGVLISFIPTSIFAQNLYLNTDFEKTDTTEKSIIQFQTLDSFVYVLIRYSNNPTGVVVG